MVCEIFGQTISYLTSDICALIKYDAGYLWAGNSTCQMSDLILRSDFWSDDVISHISFWDDISGQTLSYLTFYFDVRSWRAMLLVHVIVAHCLRWLLFVDCCWCRYVDVLSMIDEDCCVLLVCGWVSAAR